jgi:hypothetical protein
VPTVAAPTPAGALSPAAAAAVVNALTPSANAPVRVQAPQALPQQQQQPLSATSVASPAATRPLTPEERKTIERAREQEGKAMRADGRTDRGTAKAQKDAARDQQRQDEINRNAAKGEQARDASIAREKAKLEKEKARRDAEAAKAAAAAAKRQAEIDRNHQKALDEAAAKAKEAEARYQALASKSQK